MNLPVIRIWLRFSRMSMGSAEDVILTEQTTNIWYFELPIHHPWIHNENKIISNTKNIKIWNRKSIYTAQTKNIIDLMYTPSESYGYAFLRTFSHGYDRATLCFNAFAHSRRFYMLPTYNDGLQFSKLFFHESEHTRWKTHCLCCCSQHISHIQIILSSATARFHFRAEFRCCMSFSIFVLYAQHKNMRQWIRHKKTKLMAKFCALKKWRNYRRKVAKEEVLCNWLSFVYTDFRAISVAVEQITLGKIQNRFEI